MRITKDMIKQWLLGISEIGSLYSPKDYPRLSPTPFADDKARMKSDIRNVDQAFFSSARRHLWSCGKDYRQGSGYR